MQLDLESDVGCLSNQIIPLINSGMEIACMRDLTRGGLAAALVELSKASGKDFSIKNEIPVCSAVATFCEVLGLDPLSFANEGRFIVILPKSNADEALSILKKNGAPDAQIIGTVSDSKRGGRVTQKTALGVDKIMMMPSGEHLPRIC